MSEQKAPRMDVRFWMPDGSVVVVEPTDLTEVTETMDAENPRGWMLREVTITNVRTIKHAPGGADWSPRERQLVATIKELIEAGDDIRCFPSGAVGFDGWHEAMGKAQLLLGEFRILEPDGFGGWMDAAGSPV